MGDPAMRLATPDDVVELLTINGQPVDLDSQITIPALSSATFAGRVVAPDGTPRSSFDGVLHIDLYDALESRVSEEFDNSGKTLVYDVQGDKLFAGSAYVKNGEFSITVPMRARCSSTMEALRSASSRVSGATGWTEVTGEIGTPPSFEGGCLPDSGAV